MKKLFDGQVLCCIESLDGLLVNVKPDSTVGEQGGEDAGLVDIDGANHAAHHLHSVVFTKCLQLKYGTFDQYRLL